ncbi:hypothetical protein QBC34DRAFT_426138 [Podospora aff. communis PSN243]|uniref:Ig-like domain-containing protein n=1 Tax=Podospora aff. communis PSN243 TaxID=3040156 RepID=A0AAV9GKC2_9PEZI|nr:hypothetical protein QBC34DRAFT_426138 [Podospora aff. communis PSN243]
MGKRVGSLILAATAFLSCSVRGARVCGNGTSPATGSFQYNLIDVRYDGPDPDKDLGLSTIAVQLGSGATPIYECVAQWLEAWEGSYEGSPIWGDCIWTGAGFGQDKTVSMAVDWKTKTIHLTHSFDCSDRAGTEGSASGFLAIDFECAERDGADYCIPKLTAAGTRPSLRIGTSYVSAAQGLSCAANTTSRQSWRVEDWLRRYEMAPGTSVPGAPLRSDTGPSFTLRNLAANATFSCATTQQKNNTFEGSCKPTGTNASAGAGAQFNFDSRLNILKFSEHRDCDGKQVKATGVAYFQSICDRGFNSVIFTCTSEPLWVGERA